MIKIYSVIILVIIATFSGCNGSKPNDAPVPLTEPWTSINFPCKNDAVVVVSDNLRFNCAYGGVWSKESDLKTILPYVEILQKDGWKITDQSKAGIQYLLEKNGNEIILFPTSPSINTDQGTIQWEGFGIEADFRKKQFVPTMN